MNSLREIQFENLNDSNNFFRMEVDDLLKKEFKKFYMEGMLSMSKNVEMILKTLEVNNIGKMSYEDYRHFVQTIIDQLREDVLKL